MTTIEKFKYDNRIVKNFAVATMLWGIVGMLLVGTLAQSNVRTDVLKPLGEALNGLLDPEPEGITVITGDRCP